MKTTFRGEICFSEEKAVIDGAFVFCVNEDAARVLRAKAYDDGVLSTRGDTSEIVARIHTSVPATRDVAEFLRAEGEKDEALYARLCRLIRDAKMSNQIMSALKGGDSK